MPDKVILINKVIPFLGAVYIQETIKWIIFIVNNIKK